MPSHTDAPPQYQPYPITTAEPDGFRVTGTLDGTPFEAHVSEALEELRRFVGAITRDAERSASGELTSDGFADGSAVIASYKYADDEAVARRFVLGQLLVYAGEMFSGFAAMEMQRRGKLLREVAPDSEEVDDAA